MNISKPISTASSLDPGLHRRLKLAAATRGVTMSELVSSWIESNCPALDGR